MAKAKPLSHSEEERSQLEVITRTRMLQEYKRLGTFSLFAAIDFPAQ